MAMVIGVCTLELHLPECNSLKSKRAVLGRVKGRLSARFNVAVAEVEHQDLWQRAQLAIVSVASSRVPLEKAFEKAVDEVERAAPGSLARYYTEYL
jgi:uncharacterized protein YlxP (DUF503 family)